MDSKSSATMIATVVTIVNPVAIIVKMVRPRSNSGLTPFAAR